MIDRYFKGMTSTLDNDGGKGYKFINNFFKELNEIRSIQNWVDVEDEYYIALKNICKNENIKTYQKREKVVRLHEEFEEVKQLLENYLHKDIIQVFNFNVEQNLHFNIIKPYNPIDRNYSLSFEFSNVIDQDEVAEFMDIEKNFDYSRRKTHILNFNYTNTFQKYLEYFRPDIDNVTLNYIHGEINKNIVFGFGDEMDAVSYTHLTLPTKRIV